MRNLLTMEIDWDIYGSENFDLCESAKCGDYIKGYGFTDTTTGEKFCKKCGTEIEIFQNQNDRKF